MKLIITGLVSNTEYSRILNIYADKIFEFETLKREK